MFAIEPGTRFVDLSKISRPVARIRLMFDDVHPVEQYCSGWYVLPCECCTEDFERPVDSAPASSHVVKEFSRRKVEMPVVTGRFLFKK